MTQKVVTEIRPSAAGESRGSSQPVSLWGGDGEGQSGVVQEGLTEQAALEGIAAHQAEERQTEARNENTSWDLPWDWQFIPWAEEAIHPMGLSLLGLR